MRQRCCFDLSPAPSVFGLPSLLCLEDVSSASFCPRHSAATLPLDGDAALA